jgi:hypothetical protein
MPPPRVRAYSRVHVDVSKMHAPRLGPDLSVIVVLPTLYRTNELSEHNTMDTRYLRDGSREQKIVISMWLFIKLP